MQIIPHTVSSFAMTYPGVEAVYKKTDHKTGGRPEDVLVIETSFHSDEEESGIFDSFITDLLLDLETIKNEAEKYVGPVDRIDIKTF